MKIRINSSLIPIDELVDESEPFSQSVVPGPVPSELQHPQYVNGAWAEYDKANDPCVSEFISNQSTTSQE